MALDVSGAAVVAPASAPELAVVPCAPAASSVGLPVHRPMSDPSEVIRASPMTTRDDRAARRRLPPRGPRRQGRERHPPLPGDEGHGRGMPRACSTPDLVARPDRQAGRARACPAGAGDHDREPGSHGRVHPQGRCPQLRRARRRGQGRDERQEPERLARQRLRLHRDAAARRTRTARPRLARCGISPSTTRPTCATRWPALSSSPFGDKASGKVHAAAKKFGIQVSKEAGRGRDGDQGHGHGP